MLGRVSIDFIINDDELMRTPLSRMLTATGARDATLRSLGELLSDEAFETLGVVLLDVQLKDMPDVTFHELLQQCTVDMPVVFNRRSGGRTLRFESTAIAADSRHWGCKPGSVSIGPTHNESTLGSPQIQWRHLCSYGTGEIACR